MAIKLENKQNVNAPNATFPFGDVKDNDGGNNGTPLDRAVISDYWQFFAKMLDASGIVANGLLENNTDGFQYFDALIKNIRDTAASTTEKGTVERATQAEVNAGTDTTRHLTAALIAGATAIITNLALQDNSVSLSKMQNNSVDTPEIVNDAITLAKMAANSVDSDQYVDGSIDRIHLAADIIDGTKIADDVINSEHYVAGSIDNEHLAANSVDSAQYVDGSIDGIHLASGAAEFNIGYNVAEARESVSDLNNILRAGVFQPTSTASNGPVTTDFFDCIIQNGTTGGFISQVYIDFSTGIIYGRSKSGGAAWAAWSSINT